MPEQTSRPVAEALVALAVVVVGKPAAIRHLRTLADRIDMLEDEITGLKDYKWMYEGLQK